jgi:hypothetical protein
MTFSIALVLCVVPLTLCLVTLRWIRLIVLTPGSLPVSNISIKPRLFIKEIIIIVIVVVTIVIIIVITHRHRHVQLTPASRRPALRQVRRINLVIYYRFTLITTHSSDKKEIDTRFPFCCSHCIVCN